MWKHLHVKYPLFSSDFNETWIFSIDFLKTLKHQISSKSVQWKPCCSVQVDRQTDRQKNGRTWQSQQSLFAILRKRLKIDLKRTLVAFFGLKIVSNDGFWYVLKQHLPLFVSGATAQRRPESPHARGSLITHNYPPQSVGLLWTSDQPVAKASLPDNTQHSKQTDIHAPAGFEPAIPAN